MEITVRAMKTITHVVRYDNLTGTLRRTMDGVQVIEDSVINIRGDRIVPIEKLLELLSLKETRC